MNFGQFMSYYKRKNIIKKLHKSCNLNTSSIPFCIRKELKAQPLFENETFEAATYIRYVFPYIYYIAIKIFPNQQTSSDSFL